MDWIVYIEWAGWWSVGFKSGKMPAFGVRAWKSVCGSLFSSIVFRGKNFYVLEGYIMYPMSKNKVIRTYHDKYLSVLCGLANKLLVEDYTACNPICENQLELDLNEPIKQSN
jgi:hypothetical protein